MFRRYVHGLENMEYKYLQTEHYSYYRQCILAANELLKKEENKELRSFIKGRGKEHFSINDTLDYAYTGLIYMLFAFQPFSSLLDIEMSSGVVDVRPSRNLAQITQIIGKFEYLHRINVLDGRLHNNERRIDTDTNLLFNLYLRLLIDGGIDEYEDDSEYAPSGCVSFLTIHQSKGMEFPIVFVDSLSNVPRKTYKELMKEAGLDAKQTAEMLAESLGKKVKGPGKINASGDYDYISDEKYMEDESDGKSYGTPLASCGFGMRYTELKKPSTLISKEITIEWELED